MSRNVLKKWGLIRVAFAAVVGLPLITATSVFAQNPGAAPSGPDQGAAAAAGAGAQAGAAAGPGAQAEAERVIVTGSNIPTSEEVGPNPVFTLNRDLINKSGDRNTLDKLLKTQPVINSNSVPTQNNATSQGGPAGTSAIAIRGFDPGAVLTLVDGRRVVHYPGTANSGGTFTDLLTVPISAIESIEILKDGASTTYGADAVAGVVNLKFYKEYRGAQVRLYYGDTLDKDAGVYSGDLLFGTGDDKMSIVGDIFFFHHNSMFNRDRGNSNRPPFLSSNTSPYNLQVNNNVAAAAGGVDLFPGKNKNEFATPPDFTNGLAPANTYLYGKGRVRSGPRGFNFNAFSSSFSEQERWGGYAAFNDKICDDQFQLYGDFYYVDNKSHDELAPNATGNFETPGSFVIFIPPHAPIPAGAEPPGTPTAAEVGAPPGAFNPFNPFGQYISGGSRARIADFGNRVFLNENVAELFTIGIKGDKLFDGNWGYDGAFRYSQITNYNQTQDVNGPRFERILNGNDTLFNPASGDYIGQTIPYNPFNDFRRPIATNVPLIKFATLHSHNIGVGKLTTIDFNLYTTDLFDLPAGPVALAIGGAFTREAYQINPDDQNNLIHPQELGVGGTQAVKAGRKEVAFYAETRVPIFSPEMGIWGLHSMEFTAGGRFEEWRNNNTNTVVPKIGMRWQPFNEELTIRSTWGEGFLEPSMSQLYGPTFFALGPTNFANDVVSKINGATYPAQGANPESTIELQPNPRLAPEHDRTWTGGFVWSPKTLIPSQYGTITLAVDFWDVERTGAIMPLAPQVIVNRFIAEQTTPLAQTVAPVISPNKPGRSQIAALFDPGLNFAGVSSPWQNGGRMTGRGVDMELNYQLQTKYGTITSLTRATYLEDFMFGFKGDFRGWHVAGLANNDVIEGAFFGQATGGDGWMRWKGVENLDWTYKNWDLNWTVHYMGGYREEIFRPGLNLANDPTNVLDGVSHLHYVNATWFNDAQLSYNVIFTAPVESQPVAGFSKGGKEVMNGKEGKQLETTAAYQMPCWKTLLNNTTITVGCNDIFGEDPPTVFGFEDGNSTKYPGFLYDNLGRFVYGEITKKF